MRIGAPTAWPAPVPPRENVEALAAWLAGDAERITLAAIIVIKLLGEAHQVQIAKGIADHLMDEWLGPIPDDISKQVPDVLAR